MIWIKSKVWLYMTQYRAKSYHQYFVVIIFFQLADVKINSVPSKKQSSILRMSVLQNILIKWFECSCNFQNSSYPNL